MWDWATRHQAHTPLRTGKATSARAVDVALTGTKNERKGNKQKKPWPWPGPLCTSPPPANTARCCLAGLHTVAVDTEACRPPCCNLRTGTISQVHVHTEVLGCLYRTFCPGVAVVLALWGSAGVQVHCSSTKKAGQAQVPHTQVYIPYQRQS